MPSFLSPRCADLPPWARTAQKSPGGAVMGTGAGGEQGARTFSKHMAATFLFLTDLQAQGSGRRGQALERKRSRRRNHSPERGEPWAPAGMDWEGSGEGEAWPRGPAGSQLCDLGQGHRASLSVGVVLRALLKPGSQTRGPLEKVPPSAENTTSRRGAGETGAAGGGGGHACWEKFTPLP